MLSTQLVYAEHLWASPLRTACANVVVALQLDAIHEVRFTVTDFSRDGETVTVKSLAAKLFGGGSLLVDGHLTDLAVDGSRWTVNQAEASYRNNERMRRFVVAMASVGSHPSTFTVDHIQLTEGPDGDVIELDRMCLRIADDWHLAAASLRSQSLTMTGLRLDGHVTVTVSSGQLRLSGNLETDADEVDCVLDDISFSENWQLSFSFRKFASEFSGARYRLEHFCGRPTEFSFSAINVERDEPHGKPEMDVLLRLFSIGRPPERRASSVGLLPVRTAASQDRVAMDMPGEPSIRTRSCQQIHAAVRGDDRRFAVVGQNGHFRAGAGDAVLRVQVVSIGECRLAKATFQYVGHQVVGCEANFVEIAGLRATVVQYQMSARVLNCRKVVVIAIDKFALAGLARVCAAANVEELVVGVFRFANANVSCTDNKLVVRAEEVTLADPFVNGTAKNPSVLASDRIELKAEDLELRVNTRMNFWRVDKYVDQRKPVALAIREGKVGFWNGAAPVTNVLKFTELSCRWYESNGKRIIDASLKDTLEFCDVDDPKSALLYLPSPSSLRLSAVFGARNVDVLQLDIVAVREAGNGLLITSEQNKDRRLLETFAPLITSTPDPALYPPLSFGVIRIARFDFVLFCDPSKMLPVAMEQMEEKGTMPLPALVKMITDKMHAVVMAKKAEVRADGDEESEMSGFRKLGHKPPKPKK
jgi:hypothetical protein